jgi:hypothetical protein
VSFHIQRGFAQPLRTERWSSLVRVIAQRRQVVDVIFGCDNHWWEDRCGPEGLMQRPSVDLAGTGPPAVPRALQCEAPREEAGHAPICPTGDRGLQGSRLLAPRHSWGVVLRHRRDRSAHLPSCRALMARPLGGLQGPKRRVLVVVRHASGYRSGGRGGE